MPNAMPKLLRLLVALSLPPLVACEPEGLDTALEDNTLRHMPSTQSPLYVASSVLWSSPTLSVCWENPSSSNVTEREWVRTAATNSWQAQSAVRFTGWGTCPAAFFPGIRIRISDEGPHTKGLGQQLLNTAAGMVLNFTFGNWSPSCQSMRQYCIQAIAVHEFGHALGFAHEQNRPDTPTWCAAERQGSNGDWLVGAWDLDSIMNYCNPSWNGNGQLSATDRLGVWLMYPGFDQGYGDRPRGFADANGDGRADYCRFVGNPPNLFLSCALAGASGFGYQYAFSSATGFDVGYGDKPRGFTDVTADGHADYCRFVGRWAGFPSCALGANTGFGQQYQFSARP